MADLTSSDMARSDSQARIAAALNGQAVIAGGLHIGFKELAERIGSFASAPQDNLFSPTLRTLCLAAEFTGYWGVAGMLNALYRLAYGIEVTPVLSIKREEYLDRVRTLAAGLNALGTHLGDVAEGQVSSYTPLQEHFVKVQRKIKPRLLELPPDHLAMVSFMPVAPSIEVDVLWRPHPQAGHDALVNALGSLAPEISQAGLDAVAAANPYPSLAGFFEAAAAEIVVGGERPLAVSMGREFERLHQLLRSGPPLVPPAPDLMAFSSLMFVVAHSQSEHSGAQALCRRYKLRRGAGQRAVSMSDVARKFADAMVKAGEAYSQCASTRTPAPVETIAEQLLRESGVLGSSAVAALASALRRHSTGWKANPELKFDTWAFGAALVLLLQEATAEWGQEQTQDELAAVADVMAATGEIVPCETFTRKTRATAIRTACGQLLAEARQLNIDIEASVRSAGEDTLSQGQVDALQRGAGARLAGLLAAIAGLCDCLSLPWGAALSRELRRRAQGSEAWVTPGARASLFDGFMRVVAFVQRLRPNSLIDIQGEELGEFAAVLDVLLLDQRPYPSPPEEAASLNAELATLAVEGAAVEQWAAAVPDDVLLGDGGDEAIPQYEADGEVPADIVAEVFVPEYVLDASQDLPLSEARLIEDLGASASDHAAVIPSPVALMQFPATGHGAAGSAIASEPFGGQPVGLAALDETLAAGTCTATQGRDFGEVSEVDDVEAGPTSGEAPAVSAWGLAMPDAAPAPAADGCGIGGHFTELDDADGAAQVQPAAGFSSPGEGTAMVLDGGMPWGVEPNEECAEPAPAPALAGGSDEAGAVSDELSVADAGAMGSSVQVDAALLLGADLEADGPRFAAALDDGVAEAGGPGHPAAPPVPSAEALHAAVAAAPDAEAFALDAGVEADSGCAAPAGYCAAAWTGESAWDAGTDQAAAAPGIEVLRPGDVDGDVLGDLGDIEAMMGGLLSGQRPAVAQRRGKGKPSMDPQRLYEALLAPARGLPNVLDISDAELMSIMFEEACGFLDAIDATLALWRIGGVAANQLCGTVGEIRRVVHSLKGVIRTCGLAGAGAVLHAMEDRLEVTADDGSDLDSDVPVYLEAMVAVRATIELGREQFERGEVGPLPATGPEDLECGAQDADPALQVPEDVEPLVAQLGDLAVPEDIVLAVGDSSEVQGLFAEPDALSTEHVDAAADLHFGAENGAMSLELALSHPAEPQPQPETANPRAGDDLRHLAIEQQSTGVLAAANSPEFGVAVELEPGAAQVDESLAVVADVGLPSAAPEVAPSGRGAAASMLAPLPAAEPVHQVVEGAAAPAPAPARGGDWATAAAMLAPLPAAERVHQVVEVAAAPAALPELQPDEAQVMAGAPAMAEPVAVPTARAPAAECVHQVAEVAAAPAAVPDLQPGEALVMASASATAEPVAPTHGGDWAAAAAASMLAPSPATERVHQVAEVAAAPAGVPGLQPGEAQVLAGAPAMAEPVSAARVHQVVEVIEVVAAPAAVPGLQPGEARVLASAPAVAEPVAAPPAPAQARGEGSVRIPLRLANRVGDASGQLQAAGRRAQEDLNLAERHLRELEESLGRMGVVIREIDILAAASVPTSSSSPAVRGFDPLELDRYGALQEQVRRLAEAFDDVQASAKGLGDDVRRTQSIEEERAQVGDDLQRDASELTLVDVGTQRGRLERTVARACADARRTARLVIETGCRVPGAALDKLMPVFEHLLRNAVAHGIEPADAREAAAKPASGTISIGAPRSSANADGSVLRIAVRDDGRGIDHDRVLSIAVSRGLALQGVRYSREQIRNFLFMPGFSTASAVSELAGRGVGLDVVRAALTTLGGMVAIDSADGQGTEFVLTLPTDSASMAVIPVSAAGYRCLLPLSLVARVVSLASGEDVAIDVAGAGARVAGQEYPLITLASRVPVSDGAVARHGRGHLVLLSESQTVTAVLVDTVGQQRRVVVRQLGPIVRDVPGMVAGTALADGQVGIVVNPLRLQEVSAPLRPAKAATPAAPLVLVVDDSATVRLVTSRFLKRLGYQAVAARDGVEALQMIDNGLSPDGVLLDLEMPGIDGFELLAQLRQQPRFAAVPMVVISSRVGAKYAERARELGASAYLAKPYEDASLQALLSKLLVRRAGKSVPV